MNWSPWPFNRGSRRPLSPHQAGRTVGLDDFAGCRVPVYFFSKADTRRLLADEDHAVAEAYGAGGERSMYGRKYMGIIRSAFLVDEGDRISHAWPAVKPKDTAPNLLAALSR